MPLDLEADLAIFTNADEFGVFAILSLSAGAVTISGIPSKYADLERPGSNSNSGKSAFMAGTADVRLQRIQFLTAWQPGYTAAVERTLAIQSGKYTGNYRVRDIERDGDFARLILNTTT